MLNVSNAILILVTGEESIVYSCANQDQSLDQVDFNCLSDRLSQNALSEKLTKAWLRHCLKENHESTRE